jgi:hypothetical protein
MPGKLPRDEVSAPTFGSSGSQNLTDETLKNLAFCLLAGHPKTGLRSSEQAVSNSIMRSMSIPLGFGWAFHTSLAALNFEAFMSGLALRALLPHVGFEHLHVRFGTSDD